MDVGDGSYCCQNCFILFLTDDDDIVVDMLKKRVEDEGSRPRTILTWFTKITPVVTEIKATGRSFTQENSTFEFKFQFSLLLCPTGSPYMCEAG